jgi:hypothetical protein
MNNMFLGVLVNSREHSALLWQSFVGGDHKGS